MSRLAAEKPRERGWPEINPPAIISRNTFHQRHYIYRLPRFILREGAPFTGRLFY